MTFPAIVISLCFTYQPIIRQFVQKKHWFVTRFDLCTPEPIITHNAHEAPIALKLKSLRFLWCEVKMLSTHFYNEALPRLQVFGYRVVGNADGDERYMFSSVRIYIVAYY